MILSGNIYPWKIFTAEIMNQIGLERSARSVNFHQKHINFCMELSFEKKICMQGGEMQTNNTYTSIKVHKAHIQYATQGTVN